MSTRAARHRLLFVAALLGGCAEGRSNVSTPPGGSQGDGGLGGAGGAAGGSSGGAGGRGGGGAADAAPFRPDAGAAGGSGGSGGSGFADAAVSADAGGGSADAGAADVRPGPPPPPPPQQPACSVTIIPVAPQRFDGLPAGPTSTLRVEARVGGTNPPKTPSWTWTVVQQPNRVITPTVAEMNPAIVEFPLATDGNYEITATAATDCKGNATATAVANPVSRFWVRVTPPRGSNLPSIEGEMFQVRARQAVMKELQFSIAVPVAIDPRSASGLQAVYSYVRVTSPRSTVRIEGHTLAGTFTANLDMGLRYEVLVIPDAQVAPQVFSGTPGQLVQSSFTMDPGVAIGGQLSSDAGPVKDARILLRGGSVPSTTGVASATGRYDLRARAGDFAAVIIPPPGAGLPEVRLQPGQGLIIYDPPPARATMDFKWAPVSLTNLDLTVRNSDDTPVTGPMRVRLTSAAGALPNVGILTLTLDDQFPLVASGFVDLEGTSDARGVLSFDALPRAQYIATITPRNGIGAIVSVPIDLTGSAERIARTVRLGKKVSLSGRLLPATLTSGATLVALDASSDPTLAPPTSTVDPSGAYVLAVDPGRTYSLVLEASPARALPRTFLRTIVAPDEDTVRENTMVPPGLSVSGSVLTFDRQTVAGALVEAYCVGRPPSCVDVDAPDTSTVRPTASAVTDAAGAYRLVVPDPSIAN